MNLETINNKHETINNKQDELLVVDGYPPPKNNGPMSVEAQFVLLDSVGRNVRNEICRSAKAK